MEDNDNNDGYATQLRKLIGNEVVVVDDSGTRYRGLVKALNFMHLNVVLINDVGNLVVVRNVRSITLNKKE